MRKPLLILLALVIGATAGWSQSAKAQWTNILSSSPGTFQTQLVSSSESSIRVNVKVPGFYLSGVTTPKGNASIVSLPKALSTAQAGEPDVPMTGVPAIIGAKARMAVRVVDAKYKDFEGVEVAPSKGAISRQVDPSTVAYTYGSCYGQDAFFPAEPVELHEPYIMRDYRGQNMAVQPFAYNPVTKTLRVYYDLTVEMYKVDDNGDNVLEQRRGMTKVTSDFKDMYQRHFINYQQAQTRYTLVNEEGDLLIICYDNFLNAMQDFVTWKKTRGVNTTLVGTATAGTTATAIKNYIKSQYNANNNLTHVLLVGDVDQIPGNSFTAGSGTNSYSGKGDNIYGQVVGNDIYNDLFVGRFSASTVAQVATQVKKVITYERDLTANDTWVQNGLGISTSESNGGHNNEDDYQHIENIRTDLLNYGYNTVYQDYYNVSGYPSSSLNTISNHINSGVGIINYCNHGQETGWQSHYPSIYTTSNVNALTNSNKLPFIFSVACLVGKYDYSSDCFAEAWMRATHNSTKEPTGAVGTLMSYISQPWIPPMWAQDEFADILIDSYSNNIKHTWGGAAINSLFSIFDHYSTSDNSAKGTYQAWILYGDPTLMLRTKTPQAMEVSHEGIVTPDEPTYTVTVEDADGAVATITDANHNILGKATVINGQANISLSNVPSEENTELTLCVFGYNKVTYLGTVNVEVLTEWEGDGTAETPYLIKNTSQLNLLAERVNAGEDYSDQHFQLCRDLNYLGKENAFTPVGCKLAQVEEGSEESPDRPFNGIFDGNNKTISGININLTTADDDSNYQGVFGLLGSQGEVKNLNVSNSTFAGFRFVGAIVGYNGGGTVSECNVDSTVVIGGVVTESLAHGGVAGYNNGTVDKCYSMVKLTRASDVENLILTSRGGVVGYNDENGTVSNCFVKDMVADAFASITIGAIVGDNEGTISNNFYYHATINRGESESVTSGIGACVNGEWTPVDITENNGAVEVNTLNIGADIAADATPVFTFEDQDYFLHNSAVALSYTGETIEGFNPIFFVNGETVEENSFTLTTDTEVTMSFSGLDFTEISSGDSEEDPYVIKISRQWDLLAEKVASGTDYSGKFFRLDNDIDITTTVGTEATPFAGIFNGAKHKLTANLDDTANQGTAPFRYISGATIKNLTVEGTVNGTTHAAGLVGFTWSGTNAIDSCFVLADVTVNSGDNQHMGGFVGHGKKATLNLTNSVFAGTMASGGNFAGGLLGWTDGSTLNIDSVLFCGTYTGNGLFHPVACRNDNKAMNASVSHCYYTAVPTLVDTKNIAADGFKMYNTMEEVAEDGLYSMVQFAGFSCYGKLMATIDDNFKLTGEEIKPEPVVTTEYGEVVPQENNYTLEWSGDGTTSGTYTVTITSSESEDAFFSLQGSKTLQYVVYLDIMPSDLVVNANYTSAELSWTPGYGETMWNVRYKVKENIEAQQWDFEDDMDGWTVIDSDGDGNNWFQDNSGQYSCHGGSGIVASASYINNVGALTPDNWLVSPLLNLNGTFSFWTVAQDTNYPGDAFAVYVYPGTTCPTTIDLNEWTLVKEKDVTTEEYVQHTIDLSQFNFSGKGFVAIRHYDVSDYYYINIDDVEYVPNASDAEWVVVENVADNPFVLTSLSPNTTYEVQVQSVMETGEISAWTESVDFTTETISPEVAVETVTAATAQVAWTSPAVEENFTYNLRYRENDVTSDVAVVTLTAGDVWEDGSGYQMLIDADANAYGSTIPTDGGLTSSGDATEAVYNEFEYKLPENADGAMSTQNIVFNSSVTIEIPEGTYDFCITNPSPGDRIWIASSNGNVGGRKNDYLFEAGKHYTFTVTMGSDSHDQVDVVVEDLTAPWTTVENIDGMDYLVSGLIPATTYALQVQTVYADGQKSQWSEVVLFTTPDNSVPTDISLSSRSNVPETWYSIDGRKLSGRPTAKGVYIMNGKKVTIK
ncbi:MAG: DUF2436 domain-containing protein [Prevotella sp.]|nr:DUF2436 domain-containing protein [Prevotella sp.]